MKIQALQRFRFIALLEGISYVVLVFIAMPLKYMADFPEAVQYTGWAHGLLFILYFSFLIPAWRRFRWSFLKVALLVLASLIPLGAFVADRWLRQEAERLLATKG